MKDIKKGKERKQECLGYRMREEKEKREKGKEKTPYWPKRLDKGSRRRREEGL